MSENKHSPETEIALFKQDQDFIKSQLEKLLVQSEKNGEILAKIPILSESQIELRKDQAEFEKRLTFVEKWQNGIQAQLTLILGTLSVFGVSGIGALITYFISKK